MYLTKNFSYLEMIKSSTAQRLNVSNEPTVEHVIGLVNLCNHILQLYLRTRHRVFIILFFCITDSTLTVST